MATPVRAAMSKLPLLCAQLISIQPIPANRLKQIATDVRAPPNDAYRRRWQPVFSNARVLMPITIGLQQRHRQC